LLPLPSISDLLLSFMGQCRLLPAQGFPVNRKRVQRLMRLMGIESVAPKPNTSKPRREYKVYPYLLKKFMITEPDQVWCSDYYDDEIVGEFVADIIVNDMIILELKSVRRIIKAHEEQLVNYLVATGKPVGLILNFGERKVEVKRKIKDLK